ncbi:PAS domain-containing protein [Aliarcobacter skirrowii]|uniref:Histidine kinase n=1 Tax=Aliarcobacter skirrowii TaxID=28200 RepID=A0A2U2C2K0_9BACT|nr:PAS domain S-box protein [Aliarcobacter skirrowii]PWE22860.1 histidine kinase [Aliarcobacter skirrowii]PWE23264.1 histidine kinase [Aliarcobacter skirrowii]PWE25663.1 histidine kinase [Aliarcobacter skirrowii]RJO56491.1 PAS domain S-box protein [Aliarcobacter skirrowii]RJO58445.1 PAS domain S-box protein [Aliarcobacter skirrowii]
MNKIRYVILFFLVVITIIFSLNYLKNSDFEKVNLQIKDKILKDYELLLKELEDTAEFVYFTEIIKSNKIVDIISSEKNEMRLKNLLYDAIEAEYSYYTTLGVFDISFYSVDGVQILNFKDLNFKDPLTISLIEKVINSKKEQKAYKNISDEGYLLFSKPIFDKNLNLISIMNIEFDLDLVLEKLEQNSSQFKFKKLFASKLQEEDFSLYLTNKNSIKKLEKAFENREDETFVVKKDGNKNVLTFAFVSYLEFYQDSLYLVYYNKSDKKIAKIDDFYGYLLIFFSIFVVILIFILAYLLQIKRKKDILQLKYDELSNIIDNHILKIDFDLDGKITSASKAFCKSSGYSKDEIIGKNIDLLRHDDVSENFYKKLKKDLEILHTWQGEIKNRDKFGNTYWVRLKIFSIYDIKNRHIGYSSIRTDITDTKQLEKMNKLLKEDLSNRLNELRLLDKDIKDDAKISFLSKIMDSISHQWQQSISKISYELDRASDEKNFDENSIEILQSRVKRELHNLSFILNDTKKIFNFSSERRANLSSVLTSINHNLKQNLKNLNTNLSFDIDESIDLQISSFELKSIIQNIILFILDQINTYDIKKANIKISTTTILDEITIKITEDIENEAKREFLDDILNKIDDTYLDSQIHLAKLLIDKNRAIFWCKNSEKETTYYIKIKKAK